ncbi:L-2-amino-thiazoline-4-carboxylic acid hydrolase [Mycobacterium sp.]|uniref:L-2-amino-thiazoline-4-carboxylic acid hydrolase n=1 Tax=Mycobacterium sp. TaxID=1785 RepID=UPI002C05B988|nr:L-2-amino-thiazoline-4-carboxylic acid hydrolase [Mycobacterium sp.]HTQ19269.1 L-2-amino-thiazoline-4-carboxylic acid hydrolase [Mycobacterium sp.]
MPKQTTALEAVKIQARAVIPIVRALERELGKGRAHALVGQAIAESYAEWQTKAVTARNSHPRNTDIEAQLPIETDVVEDSDTTYAVNMTRCQFAEYFRGIGAADVGALLTCGVDFAAEAALRPDWEFRRTQTIMGGASHCDFRWRLRTAAEGEEAKPQNDGG